MSRFVLHSARVTARTFGFLLIVVLLSISCDTFSSCCKTCTTGKACGDTCISKSDTCHVGRGCACNG